MELDEPISNELALPPSSTKLGKAVSLSTNFFDLSVAKQRVVYRYNLSTTPPLSTNDDHMRIRKKLVRRMRDTLEPLFDPYIFYENQLFSPEKIEDSQLPKDVEVQFGEDSYLMTFELLDESFPTNEGIEIYLRAFLDTVLSKNKMAQLDSSTWFNVDPLKQMSEGAGFNMYMKFSNSLRLINGQTRLIMNPGIKFIQNENMANILYNMQPDDAEDTYIGQTVITQYNKKVYKIERIHNDMNPTHEFTNEKG